MIFENNKKKKQKKKNEQTNIKSWNKENKFY